MLFNDLQVEIPPVKMVLHIGTQLIGRQQRGGPVHNFAELLSQI